MLSGITSYLFGGNNAEDYNQPEAEKPRCRLRTRHDENEWLIVDPSSSQDSSPDRLSRQHVASGSARGSQESLGSNGSERRACHRVPAQGLPEESWFVTPPSCFTAGGASPANVQPHPMENLLIEHPSMSVYDPRGRPASADLESDASESSTEGAPPVRPSTSRPTMAVVSRPPRRAHAIAARAGILAQAHSARALQRAQVKHNKRKLSRNSFARGNRLVETAVAKQPRTRQISQPICKGGNRRQ